MKKVSVIVPVYNGEKHLPQCVDSILNQTLRDIEIIFVDDGSTDESCQMLDHYALLDCRVKVLHQENQYAGAARNKGMRIATGEYLVFWDCDDFFELNALEELYHKAVQTNADICVCGANQFYERLNKVMPCSSYMNKKNIPETETFNIHTNEHILTFTTEAAWNKMFKKSFVDEHELLFQEIRNGNDVFFTINSLCMAERIAVVNKPLVNYRKNQTTSLVSTLSKSALTPFMAWVSTAENLKKKGIFPEKSFVNKAMGSTLYLLRNIQSREAFLEAVKYLQNGAIQTLGIYPREEDFYSIWWYNEASEHLVNDSPEDFQVYLAHRTYILLIEAAAKNNKANADIKKKIKRIDKLENEVETSRKHVEELENQVETSRKCVEELENEVETLKKRVDKLKNETEAVRNSWSYRIGNKIVKMAKVMKIKS